MLWAKTMTSKGKQSPLLHVIRACSWRWPDVVAGISARFPKFAFVLFCYLTNHFMTGPLEISEFCFPRISMFPRIRLGKHWESRETKFTVPLGTSHYTKRYFVTPIQSNSAPLDINIMSARTLYSCRARQWDKKIDGLKRKKMSFKFCLLLLDVMNIWFMLFSLWMSEGFLTLRSNRRQSRWPTKALPARTSGSDLICLAMTEQRWDCNRTPQCACLNLGFLLLRITQFFHFRQRPPTAAMCSSSNCSWYLLDILSKWLRLTTWLTPSLQLVPR